MALLTGKAATGRLLTGCLFTTAAMCQKKWEGQKNSIDRIVAGGSETKKKTQLNTDTLITVYIKGVQSRDGECLEQPLLTSFVQAGNINSSQHQVDKNLAIVYNTIFFKSDHNLLFVQKKKKKRQKTGILWFMYNHVKTESRFLFCTNACDKNNPLLCFTEHYYYGGGGGIKVTTGLGNSATHLPASYLHFAHVTGVRVRECGLADVTEPSRQLRTGRRMLV